MPKILYFVGYLMALEGQWDRIFNIWVVPENWVAWLLKGCILILREQKRIEK